MTANDILTWYISIVMMKVFFLVFQREKFNLFYEFTMTVML